MATPVNSTTTSGPVTYANESAVMITWSAIPRRSAGPGHRGAVEQEHDRHDTRRVGQCLGDPTPRVQRGDAFVHVGAGAGHPPDDRDPELDRESHGPLDRLPFGGADRATVLAAVEVEPAHLPAVEIPEGRLDCLAPVPEDGRRRCELRHSAEG